MPARVSKTIIQIMNKLQLYITKSLRGYKNLVNFNPSEDVRRHVQDLRQALKTVNYDSTEKNIFYMLKYTGEGVFVVVLRTIPDKPLDHLGAWIYVPNGLDISAGQLYDAVRLTTKKVSGAGVGEADIAELRQVFATEYTLDRNAPAIVANQGTDYAFCYYGGEGRGLAEFFGEHLYQPGFLRYRGVLLLEDGIGVNGVGADLTEEPLQEVVPVNPPEPNPAGFAPYIYGEPFDRPFKAPLHGEVVVSWRRQGFDDIEQPVAVEEAGVVPEMVAVSDARKAITPASFNITSQDTKEPLRGCVIKVNGIEIAGGHKFTQNDLSQAHVWVACEGYFPYSARMDLASTTQALIQMQERRKVYQFEMPLKSSEYGAPIKFEIRSKRELAGSPIDGYELLDSLQEGPTRTNYLGYTGPAAGPWWQKAAYAVAGLVVGIILMFVLGRCSDSPTGAAPSVQPEVPADTSAVAVEPQQMPVQPAVAENNVQTAPVQAEPAPVPEADAAAQNASLDEAVAYLDSNRRWSREQMEQFAALRGLFDALNTYDFKSIRESWGPKLAKSKSFAKVVEASRKAVNKKTDLKRNRTHTPTYNREGDTVIGWEGYTYYIDP